MNRFCQECGHEAQVNDRMCTNCGTKLIDIQQPQPQRNNIQAQVQAQPHGKVQEHAYSSAQAQEHVPTQAPLKPQKEKKPMSMQQKIIFSVVGALAVLLIGFSIWANMYFSKESTEDRFYKAVENKDAAQLENLLIHENGKAPSNGEVEAFIQLADDINDDDLEDLVSLKKEGKFIGIFQMYKVEAIDQYAYYDGPHDGLEMKFNNSDVKVKKDSDGLKYGPLLPGNYTVNVSLDNDFGKSNTDVELVLANPYSEEIWMDELPIGESSVYVWNYDSELMSNSYLLVNDQKVEIDEYGDSEVFGPIFLDGSQQLTVVANYPWGEVETEPFSIDSRYMEIGASMVDDEDLENMKDLLLTFGEEMQNSKAQLSTNFFTSATDIFKEDFLYYEIDPLVQENLFYTGKLNSIDFNADTMWFYDGLVMVHTLFDYSYAFFEAGEEPPTMEDYDLHTYVGLAYDEANEEWKVSYIEMSNHEAVEGTDTIEGSGKVYKPDPEALTSVEMNSVRTELQDFMETYTIASVDAINYGDISFMSPYITSDGPRYNEAKDYIDYLVEKGITEEYLSTQVMDVVDKGNGVYVVTTQEEFVIYYPDDEAVKAFETVVEVRNEDGYWKVHQLISTKEI